MLQRNVSGPSRFHCCPVNRQYLWKKTLIEKRRHLKHLKQRHLVINGTLRSMPAFYLSEHFLRFVKVERFIPVFKVDIIYPSSNYSSISVLSLLSKILKRIILTEHCPENHKHKIFSQKFQRAQVYLTSSQVRPILFCIYIFPYQFWKYRMGQDIKN